MPKPLRVLEPVLPPAEGEQPFPLYNANWAPSSLPASGEWPTSTPTY